MIEHAEADGRTANQGGEHEHDGERDEKGDDDRLQVLATSPKGEGHEYATGWDAGQFP